jgi:microcystin-dependent protein
MALETASYINQLNAANPSSSDRLQQGDDHIRLLKATLKASFPNITGPMTLGQDFLNQLEALIVPTGFIGPFFGDEAPTGWAICDGSTVAKSDGSGNIVTPDLRGHTVIGASTDFAINQAHGQRSRSVTTNTAGGHTHTATAASVGAHDHGGDTAATVLTVDQLPNHGHYVARLANSSTRFSSGGGVSDAVATDKTDQGDSNYNLTATSGAADRGASSKVGSNSGHTHEISEDGAHTHALTVEAVAAHSHTATVDVVQPSYALHWIIKI